MQKKLTITTMIGAAALLLTLLVPLSAEAKHDGRWWRGPGAPVAPYPYSYEYGSPYYYGVPTLPNYAYVPPRTYGYYRPPYRWGWYRRHPHRHWRWRHRWDD